MCGLNSDGFGFFNSTDGGNLRNFRVPAEREAMATMVLTTMRLMCKVRFFWRKNKIKRFERKERKKKGRTQTRKAWWSGGAPRGRSAAHSFFLTTTRVLIKRKFYSVPRMATATKAMTNTAYVIAMLVACAFLNENLCTTGTKNT